VRKRLAILFVAIYLLGTTEAYQLLKVPALIVHYVQHAREDPELDLFSFLRMHYAEDQVFDADWQQDMQLPFKSHEDTKSLVPLSYYPPIFLLPVNQPSVQLTARPVGVIKSFSPGLYAADIFQPPRI
jgi:hypothetical protein